MYFKHLISDAGSKSYLLCLNTEHKPKYEGPYGAKSLTGVLGLLKVNLGVQNKKTFENLYVTVICLYCSPKLL